MLTIICGEDTAASRKYFDDLKKQYLTENYFASEVKPEQVSEITKELANSNNLFEEKRLFITTNLDKYYKKITFRKRGEDPLSKALSEISASKQIIVLDWEDKSAWELKIKKITPVKEFKMKEDIFKLLDSLYPKNKLNFLQILDSLSQSTEEQFIFIMLARHIRNLILAASNSLPNMAPWQKSRVISQAQKWSSENLVKFYEGIQRIDIGLKTSSNPQGIKKSLDILACFFL